MMRREYALALLLGAAGAGLIVLALRQAWAVAVFTAPRPLPAQDISVTGQQLVPLAGALALAGLACLAAVIATRPAARRVAGVVLAALGAGAAAAAGAGVSASSVLAVAQSGAAAGALGGSTTSGTSPGGASHAIVIAGSAGHAVMTGMPWRAAAVAGGLAIILAGLAAAWHGPRWPVMSARFDRPGQRPGQQAADSASIWESLNRNLDPTEDNAVDSAVDSTVDSPTVDSPTVDSTVGPGSTDGRPGGVPPS
jgi:uncharacterized membrane protein (TIGR02234 family)